MYCSAAQVSFCQRLAQMKKKTEEKQVGSTLTYPSPAQLKRNSINLQKITKTNAYGGI